MLPNALQHARNNFSEMLPNASRCSQMFSNVKIKSLDVPHPNVKCHLRMTTLVLRITTANMEANLQVELKTCSFLLFIMHPNAPNAFK